MYPPTYPQALWIRSKTSTRGTACAHLSRPLRALWAKSFKRASAASVSVPRLFGGRDVHRDH